jgi:pimeloyl-ACP methyl ester carboxylesterase/predicted glycosyltransferase
VSNDDLPIRRTDNSTPARRPNVHGVVERDGVRLHWERYGTQGADVFLLPTWSINHSRHWRAQIGYLARHFRVLTFDARGNGLSDRPQEVSAYAPRELVADAVSVLDAAGVGSACLVGLSLSGLIAVLLAADHADRATGVFVVGCHLPMLTTEMAPEDEASFDAELHEYDGWDKVNRHYWLRDYRGFLEFFLGEVFPEPHSTKPIEDTITWGLDTTPETLILTELGLHDTGIPDKQAAEEFCRRVRCPVQVVHGALDVIVPFAMGARVAELTGGELVRFEGCGHAPTGRDPVRVNLLLRRFVEEVTGPRPRSRTWTHALSRPRRALVVSSPIGLGHAWRDVVIADELRRRVPRLEIHWLAQEPVTTLLRSRDEVIHPASEELASEAEHIDAEAGEHRLHAFQAVRRMDDILLANFMLFHDIVSDEHYDVWIGDEAWELDHFLHENPELKTAPFVWMTDFVGALPMPEGGDAESALTADHNAEMIEHVDRFPYVRDRAIYFGEPEDIVDGAFGPGLPEIRAWTEQHYHCVPYVPAFDPAKVDRVALRTELGMGDEPVCVVTAGGSAAGAALIRRTIEALPSLRERRPDLRVLVAAGPRIEPGELPSADGLEVVGYVHALYRYLAACDVAVAQGGLATTMELVAGQRPFVAFPLRSHYEQRFHVRHRLDRHGATTWMEYEDARPDALADVVDGLLASRPAYRGVAPTGAARAADLIAQLL